MRKTFSSVFQVKQRLNPLSDRALRLSMYLRFRFENVLIIGTQVRVLPIFPKNLDQIFFRFYLTFPFPEPTYYQRGKM